MSGSYIATTTEDDVQWLMAAGQSLGLSVAQLRHHLAQHLSPAHGALLAEPVEDQAGRATDWYGEGEGAATPLDQLPPGPRAAMTNRVWALLRDIRAEGVRLGASADTDERVLGAMLEKVSHVPDVSCARVRGEAPVVIAWGHGRAGVSVDLSSVFKPVEVPKRPVPVVPAPGVERARPAWLVPVLILAVLALGVAGALFWRQSQPGESASTVATAPPPIAMPAERLPAAQPPIVRPEMPQVTTQAAPPETPPATPPSPPPSTTGSTSETRTSTAQRASGPAPTTQAAAPPETPPPPPPKPAESGSRAPPSTTGSTSETRTSTVQSASPAPTPTPTDTPTPPAPGPVAGLDPQPAPLEMAPVDTPPRSPPSPDLAQLPPHESEPAPISRPFTAAAVRNHDLRMLQGCWTVQGGFATAEVQTHKAAKVSNWRTCFGPAAAGAASLSGTQLLGWEDGKSCTGAVTARFLADDRLEIADASDCLGDRTLFRMTEQCARKDDASMVCSWTAHDRSGGAEFRGDGLALTPGR